MSCWNIVCLDIVSKAIYSLHISLSFSSFSFIGFNILYPDESGNGVLTWRLNPRRVYYGKTARSADRGERYSSEDKEHTWPPGFYSPGGLSLLLCVMFVYSIFICLYMCVCVCSCDCTVVTEPWGHQNIPQRELWSAPLGCLHFPMQPNLSQRTKSCQIRTDSYRSNSSSQTRQLHGGKDYSKGEGDSPIGFGDL